MRRSRRDDDGGCVHAGAIAGGMTDGAVLGDARKAECLLGESDWQLAAFLPGNAERTIAAWSRQQIAKYAWQHVKDRVGHAAIRFGAQRADRKSTRLNSSH